MSPADIDVAALRADTAGVDDAAHLDNAGSSLPPRPVVDAQIDFLRVEERTGGYEAQRVLADRLDAFYTATAELLGCATDEVAFVTSASEGWWRAFTSIPLRPGDRVLVGTSEFQANAFGLLQASARGVVVDIVPNDEKGLFDLDAFESMLDERVRLVCLTHISMSNGAIHPAAEVGRRCRAAGVTFLLDACQAAGQIRLDVADLGCDFLVYTSRKFMRGPRGAGVLYARRDVTERLAPSAYVDGRSAEWLDDGGWELHDGAVRFELGEQGFAAKAALAVATRYALGIGIDAIEHRITDLAAGLRERLDAMSGVTVYDEGGPRSGIVTFGVDGHDPHEVGARLRDRGVRVSTPGRRNAQWDIGRRGLDAVVRAGVHYYNTDDELDRLCDALERP